MSSVVPQEKVFICGMKFLFSGASSMNAFLLGWWDIAQSSVVHLACTIQRKYEKCWCKILVLTRCWYPQHIIRDDILCCNTVGCSNTRCYFHWGPVYMSSRWQALWLPPTEIHAEAESEDRIENIGHVFVHRPQRPILNSWRIAAQSYSKDESADSCFEKHVLTRSLGCSDFF